MLAELAAKQAAGATDLRTRHDNRLAELGAELERLKRQSQADIAEARTEAEAKAMARAAEQLKAAEAEWKTRSDKALAELAAKQAARQDAQATDLRTRGNDRVAELSAELERQRIEAQAEIASLKAGADVKLSEALAAAEAEWRKRSDETLAAMTARLEAADRAAKAPPARDEEIKHLEGQIEYLRNWSEAEIAATKLAAEAHEVQQLKDAEAKWRAASDAALALVTARCVAAETALAAADTGAALGERDREIAHLREEIARQAQMAEADMAAAKAAADIAAGEKLKAAQAIWEQETAGALARANARSEAAETALDAERRAAAGRVHEDEYVHSLEREIKTLRATLVDREAALAQNQAMQENIRLGTVRDTPGTRWQPLQSGRMVGERNDQLVEEEPRRPAKDNGNTRLLRDAGVVVMVAAAAVLLLPKLEGMLPNNVRWQIETVGGLFMPSDTPAEPAAPVAAAAATQPKAEHPLKYATRSINVRAQPSTGAAVAVNLKRGAAVAVLETRGSWDRVEISASQGAPTQGWVFNTYLSDTDPGDAPPVAAARSAAAPAREAPVQATPAAATPEATDAAPTP
jgi:hypothetical protein